MMVGSTPPTQRTSPTWGPPLPYKQALKVGWLDKFFYGWYLPSLSTNFVGTIKDMGKRLPQLHDVKMKISCNRSRHGNVMTPKRCLFTFVFLCTGVLFVCLRHRFRVHAAPIIASIMVKFEQIL